MLPRDEWREVSLGLDEALTLAAGERAAWLEALRRRRPELAKLLEGLLEQQQVLAAERFMEEPPWMPEPAAAQAGATVGTYRLLERAGEGGMGSVWRAVRSDGRFEREVAIKFLHAALRSQAAVEGFEREGKLLGRLSHPHIAELMDAGVAPDGVPYLVLEFVDGLPLDRHCDVARLSVEARLRLFLDVAGAVAHAHANLVVHRDIKPSNVLATLAGQVKLLDFGIAKLLGGEAQSGEATTLEGGRALTPLFAAPEQLTGGPITTATDVYALGALLYLLLTGQAPAGPGPHTPAELIAAITGPGRPAGSEAAATMAGAVAGMRGSTPERLRRQLRGDLDTILAKALKKDPRERYASVTAMAEDVRLHLRREPIRARPDTLGYRTRTFVRRNRLAVALAAGALLTATAGGAGIVIQTRAARRQRDFALLQLQRAEGVSDLENFVLTEAAPAGRPVLPGELLRRAEAIVRRQQTDPDTRLDLLVAIGEQYAAQGAYQKARPLLQEAYQTAQGGAEPTTRAAAACALGRVLSQTGAPARGEALFEAGLAQLPTDRLDIAERVRCLLHGSEIATNSSHYRSALSRAQSARDLLRHARFRSGLLQLDTDIALAGAYNDADRRAEANLAYQQALQRATALGRGDTPLAANLLNHWATMLIRAGRPRDAEPLLDRALAIAGGSPAAAVPGLLGNFTGVLLRLGRPAEARPYSDRALALSGAGGDAIELAKERLDRIRILRAQGQLDQAERLTATVAAQLHRILPRVHIAFAVLASEEALNARARGRLPAALRLADQAVRAFDAAYPHGSGPADYRGRFLVRRSEAEAELGENAAALADARRALQLLQKAAIPGSNSADVGEAYAAVGGALRAEGHGSEATAAYRDAAENLDRTLGPDHRETRAVREELEASNKQ